MGRQDASFDSELQENVLAGHQAHVGSSSSSNTGMKGDQDGVDVEFQDFPKLEIKAQDLALQSDRAEASIENGASSNVRVQGIRAALFFQSNLSRLTDFLVTEPQALDQSDGLNQTLREYLKALETINQTSSALITSTFGPASITEVWPGPKSRLCSLCHY